MLRVVAEKTSLLFSDMSTLCVRRIMNEPHMDTNSLVLKRNVQKTLLNRSSPGVSLQFFMAALVASHVFLTTNV